MKLTRLRIEQLRKFRRPLEIDGLEAGLNLFSGPNEAGKSTIVAAIRAAFFERYRSNGAENLRPFGDSSASPTVELQFTVAAQPYRLIKSFLGRKRCELHIGSRHLEGAEAEAHLAGLLGFTYAAKGGSQAAHWGIPGLLWIQQGNAHELQEPVHNATDYLRRALTDAVGEIVAGEGDEILAAVLSARSEVLSEVQKKPRGAYEEALRRQQELDGALAALDDAIADYRDKVDRLAQLREEQRIEQQENLAAHFLAQQQATQRALADIAGDEEALRAQRQRLAQLQQQLALLRSRLDGFTDEEEQLRHRAATMADAEQVWRTALTRADHWQQQHLQAETLYEQACREWQRSLRHEKYLASRGQLQRAEREAQSLRCALAQAEAEQQQLSQWQRQLAATAIAEEELSQLRQLDGQIRTVRIRREALATRVRFTLDAGRHIRIDDEEVSGSGERELSDTAEIELPSLGRLEISRADSSLTELQREEAVLTEKWRALLQRLNVDSVVAAEQRRRRHQQLEAEISAARLHMKALAPDGIDVLRAALTSLDSQMESLRTELANQPEPPGNDETAAASIETEAERDRAGQQLARVREALSEAKIAAAGAQAAHEAARREHAAARERLTAPERTRELAATNRQLTDTRAEAVTVQERVETLADRLGEAQPELLRQDAERWRQSAEQHRKRGESRKDTIMQLDIALQTLGAQGLEEKRGTVAQQHASVCRRVAELQRRAEALDLLVELLQRKRRLLTLALQAPLQRYLQHYVRMLLPAAAIEIDEDLTPGPLQRGTGHDSRSDAFDHLSFGAREQLGVISRLAYADLLKESGHPTLIILDDALVHSDEARLSRIKRILFDAATRHQILLFTCHPRHWQDLGAPITSLPPLPGGGQ